MTAAERRKEAKIVAEKAQEFQRRAEKLEARERELLEDLPDEEKKGPSPKAN